jgi:hypothetical protein
LFLVLFLSLLVLFYHHTALETRLNYLATNSTTKVDGRGIIQPFFGIEEIFYAKGAAFRHYFKLAFRKIKIDVKELQFDLMSVLRHKFFGPKVIDGIYINDMKRRKPYFEPLQKLEIPSKLFNIYYFENSLSDA